MLLGSEPEPQGYIEKTALAVRIFDRIRELL
jgi:hypothetical protein